MKRESLHNHLVTIAIKPHQIQCSIVAKNDRTQKITLLACKTNPIDNLACEQLNLFNPTWIENVIRSFLQKHNAQNYFAACTLRGPHMIEEYMIAEQQTAGIDELITKKDHHAYASEYVYPLDDHQSVFYVCGIAQPLLLQYKLLAHRLKLRLLSITTETMALLHLYKYFYGNAFRSTQLALDMMRHHNIIEQFFTPDAMHRLIDIKKSEIKDTAHALTACGLFVAERLS